MVALSACLSLVVVALSASLSLVVVALPASLSPVMVGLHASLSSVMVALPASLSAQSVSRLRHSTCTLNARVCGISADVPMAINILFKPIIATT